MHILDLLDISIKDVYDFLQKSDTMSDTQMWKSHMTKRRKSLLEMHPFRIWERNGSYFTYLKDTTRPNGRRQIQRKTLEDLEEEIIKNVQESDKVTIGDLYEQYVKRKQENDDIKPATIHRYNLVFKRHYIATGWDKKNISDISLDQYADFIEDEIGRNNLNAKALANFKCITTGIIKRAAKKHLIDYTYSMVYDFIDVRPKKTHKNPQDEIITGSELMAFVEYVEQNKDVMNLALLLMAVSGLRVGEMSTLKFSDFVSPTSFRVCRTETFYKGEDGKKVYEVGETTKTDAGKRVAYIPRQFGWIVKELRRLNPFAEFVCTDSKGIRIRSYRLRSRLYYICKKLPEFSQAKSPHKLRKTFCSILLDQGFDNNFIISIMGHTNIAVSENFYHFDRKSSAQKQKMIDSVAEFQFVISNQDPIKPNQTKIAKS